jgi:hypothetical protein
MVPVVDRLSHWPPWSLWWAEYHQKNEIKNLLKNPKKINTLPTGPRGPHGGQALPLVPVVPVVGRISQKYEIKNLKKKKILCPPVPVVPVVGKLSHGSPCSPWWAESKKKNEIRNLEKEKN